MAAEIRLSYDPYDAVDWTAEQRYYNFHAAHIRGGDPTAILRRYEASGHGGVIVSDAPCRDDKRQMDRVYWPWDVDPATLTRHHQDGMVAIRGAEFHGRGVNHVLGVHTDWEPSCEEDVDALIEGIGSHPRGEFGGLAIVAHPSTSHDPEDVDYWVRLFERHDALVGVEAWVGMTTAHEAVWERLLDTHSRRLWGFGNDNFVADERESTTAHFDVNRNYVPLRTHTADAVAEAIARGAFYITHAPDETEGEGRRPPEIESIDVDSGRQSITIRPRGDVTVVWRNSSGRVAEGPTLAYGDHAAVLSDSWVRGVLRGAGSVASTQPFSFDRSG